MRLLLLIPALALGAIASAQEIYKTVDEDGNIIYSDTPPSEGAAPAELPDIILQPSVTPTVQLKPPDTEESIVPIRVTLSSPANDAVILASAPSMPVTASVSRALAEQESAQLLVNGKPYGSASKGLSWNVGNLIRGEYSLQILIIKNGNTVATSQAVKVFVQRNIAR